MRQKTAIRIGLLLGWTAAIVAGGEPSDFSSGRSSQVARLIERLGDDAFPARENAAQRLISLGMQSHAALTEGRKHPDAEIRRRCGKLLQEILRRDYQLRLERFVLDDTGKIHLPGWTRFRELAGDGKPERQLFVDMHRSEPALLTGYGHLGEAISPLLTRRCQQLQQGLYNSHTRFRQEITMGSLAAMVFIGSDPEIPLSDVSVSYISNFSYRPALQSALTDGAFSPALRKLLAAWVKRPPEGISGYQRFLLALRHDLSEALQPALEALEAGESEPQVRHYAVLVVGRFAGKKQRALLESLLSDEGICMTAHVNNSQIHVQVRDVALAALLHITGQKFAAYGLGRARKDPKMLIHTYTLGYQTQQQRAAAIKKYLAWSAVRKKTS